LAAGFLEALQLAEGGVELAVQVGFVAEEAVESGGGGEAGFVAGLSGELAAFVILGAVDGLADDPLFDGGHVGVGGLGLIEGEAAAAPLGEGEVPGELGFHGADGVEVGGEGVAEGFPGFQGLVFQDDGIGGGEAVLDGVDGGAGFAGGAFGAADAGAGADAAHADAGVEGEGGGHGFVLGSCLGEWVREE
jgi:hypothetical protein